MARRWSWTLLVGMAAVASAQVPPPAAPASAQRFDSPYRAFEAGAYDQALAGFVDRQVERPGDAELALNVGAAHYKMRNWEEAGRAFSRAALGGDPQLRGEALYNLGNVAYRQGRLEDAVELYKGALEADPDDEDAKFNLEFVRDEIRRRHEEAKQRQQNRQDRPQPEQDQPGQQEEPQTEDGEEPPPEGASSPQETPQPDTDGDGLGDELERRGENPTDPENPDTDGDGLPDGVEDSNRNGRVDGAETDPNNPDSDGDGTPDGVEAAASEGAGEPQPGDVEELTAEEAERYLAALEEGRPQQGRRRPGRRVRSEKDW